MSLNIKAFFANPKSYLIGVVLLFVSDKAWEYLHKGVEADINTKIQAQVVIGLKNPETIRELTENKAFVNLFFESETVKGKIDELADEIAIDIRNAIIDDVSKSDSLKVSTRAEMSKRLDIREDNYFPLLEKALRAVLKEENASKKDVKKIIRKER